MTVQPKNSFLTFIFALVGGILLLPFISSCGKGTNASPIGLNTQLQIINLSPDLQPVNLYLNFIKESTNAYSYPTNSGYFFLSTLTPPLQFRSATTNPVNLLTFKDTLKSNAKYTLFITGYKKDSSINKSILVLDTATLPPLGFAKVRFAHTSPSSPILDLKANETGSNFWKNIGFDSISNYVKLPVGNYNFTINTSANQNKIETQILSFTLKDGWAYTVYTKGIVGRTDSVAFGADILSNNLLLKTTH